MTQPLNLMTVVRLMDFGLGPQHHPQLLRRMNNKCPQIVHCAVEIFLRISTSLNGCRNGFRLFSECGVANTEKRIVGGQPAHVHEYPWIGLILDDRNRVVCGASLINDRYALTAAHCIVGMDVPKLTVIFLAHNRSDTSEPERIYATVVIFQISLLIDV